MFQSGLRAPHSTETTLVTNNLIIASDPGLMVTNGNLTGISPSSNLSVRNLGVTFDKDLSFNPHPKMVSRSTFFHVQYITKIRKVLTQHDAE